MAEDLNQFKQLSNEYDVSLEYDDGEWTVIQRHCGGEIADTGKGKTINDAVKIFVDKKLSYEKAMRKIFKHLHK